MPECFYRASMILCKIDSRQTCTRMLLPSKHAGMTELGIEAIEHLIY
jgi:hypothetical protein